MQDFTNGVSPLIINIMSLFLYKNNYIIDIELLGVKVHNVIIHLLWKFLQQSFFIKKNQTFLISDLFILPNTIIGIV